MKALKQSFAWWCFANRGVAPEALLRSAATIGYKAVELIEPEYWSLAQNYGLKIASIAGHQSIEQGLNRYEHHQRIEQELLANIELAVQWGISHLICFSGNRAGLSDEEGLQITVEGLRRIAPVAEQAKVNLILELLNSKVDHPDYQCDRTLWGVEVCRLVNSPCVKLLYDIYHLQIMEGDIIRTIQTHHSHFAHYHTAGNPGRHDLDATQELNYPPIFQAIRATDYAGFIGHEFIPNGDPIKALQQSFELCSGTI